MAMESLGKSLTAMEHPVVVTEGASFLSIGLPETELFQSDQTKLASSELVGAQIQNLTPQGCSA